MRRLFALMTIAGLLVISLPAMAGNISIGDAWAMASSDASKPGAIMLTISNSGSDADNLLAVETPVAGMAQVHNSKMKADKMRMRRMKALEVPGGATVAFRHDGTHIMLMQLSGPLTPGQSFPVTLVFEKAGRIQVEVSVRGG